MPINALFPLMSMNYFEGSTLYASVVEIVFAVGMLLGGLLLGAWGGFKKRMANIIGSIFLMGVSLTVSGLLPTNGFMIFAICCTLMGFSAPFYNGVQTALFQEQIQPEYLGRVFGLLGSIMSFAMPLEDTAADPYVALVKRLAVADKLDFDTAKLLIQSYKKTKGEDA